MDLQNKVALPENAPLSSKVSKMIVIFGFVMVFLVGADVLYRINLEWDQEKSAVWRDAENFTHAFEEHALRTVESANQTVVFVKYQYEKQGKAFDIQRYVRETGFADPSLLMIGVIDENGTMVASTEPITAAINLSDTAYFRFHQQNDDNSRLISRSIMGRITARLSMHVTQRINKPDGSFAGVAVVSMDPYYFTDFYRKLNLGANATVSIVGSDGIVRIRQMGNSASFEQDMSRSAFMKSILTSTQGNFIENSVVDNIERIYSYRKLREYPLYVLVGIDTEEAFAAVKKRSLGYFAIGSGVTVLIAIFTVMLLRILRRQRETAEALRQSRDGLEIEVEARTGDLSKANNELMQSNQELQTEITERQKTERQLQEANRELGEAYTALKNAQIQMISSEKMASIGQLAAGVAHEINNPLGFVMGNFETLQGYMTRLFEVLDKFEKLQAEAEISSCQRVRALSEETGKLIKNNKLDYIRNDMEPLLEETRDGLRRVRDIVQALRLFSREDQQGRMGEYSLNDGLQNTLAVSRNELKYVAEIKQELREIPAIEAIGGQINQVLLNILVNAAYAVKEKNDGKTGLITIETSSDDRYVYCSISDNGIGMPAKVRQDIFNPFFTTKPIGEGTGLGLSISYDIIVNKHHGRIWCESEEGQGTVFTIKLPIKQPSAEE